MGLITWMLKSKKSMAKPNTNWVKIGKYNISRHAQNKIADISRNLQKKDMLINLFGKDSINSDLYIHRDGNLQYDRVNDRNRTITHITQRRKVVKSIQKFHNDRNGVKGAYKNFKGGKYNGFKKK